MSAAGRAAPRVSHKVDAGRPKSASSRATGRDGGRGVGLWRVRIALVILHADPKRGGAERYTVDLASALRGRGHSVSLIATSFADRHADDLLLDVGRGTRVGKYSSFLNQLDKALAQRPAFDVVHAMLPVRRCDVYHPHAGIAAEAVERGHLKHEGAVAQIAARVGNRMNLRRQKFAAVERALLEGNEPPIVLCLSEYVKKEVTAHYPLPADRLATLFNAVDLKKFDPDARPEARDEVRRRLGIADDDVMALMIAQDFARKGLAVAIEAVAKCADSRLKLVVVGRDDPSAYQRQAEAAGISKQVIFAGPTDDPYSFYRAADFFVLPTRHDPCSLAVLEALAMGLPVISTRFNGACEIMQSGKHGFVLENPTDTDALAAAIKSLSGAKPRSEMGRACRELRNRLSYNFHVDQLLEIYSKAISLKAGEGRE